MKLAMLMQNTGGVYGAERASLDLASGLKAAGHRIRPLLIEESRRNDLGPALTNAWTDIGLPPVNLPTAHRFSPALARAIRSELVAHQTAALLTTGYKADVHGVWATRSGYICPQISTVHGWLYRRQWKERIYGQINLLALKHSTAVVVLSRYYKELLTPLLPVQRLHRIPTGLDAECVAPIDDLPSGHTPDTPFVVGWMGRFSEEKNVPMLLKAMAQLVKAHPAAQLMLAGDGPLRHELETQCEQLGIASSVTFAGYLNRDEFFPHIDAFVLCSHIENRPYSIMEAMCWARPVAATRVGGIPDLVGDENGQLIEDDDAQGLAKILLDWATHPEKAHQLGRQGRHLMITRDSAKQAIQAFDELLVRIKKGAN